MFSLTNLHARFFHAVPPQGGMALELSHLSLVALDPFGLLPKSRGLVINESSCMLRAVCSLPRRACATALRKQPGSIAPYQLALFDIVSPTSAVAARNDQPFLDASVPKCMGIGKTVSLNARMAKGKGVRRMILKKCKKKRVRSRNAVCICPFQCRWTMWGIVDDVP